MTSQVNIAVHTNHQYSDVDCIFKANENNLEQWPIYENLSKLCRSTGYLPAYVFASKNMHEIGDDVETNA